MSSCRTDIKRKMMRVKSGTFSRQVDAIPHAASLIEGMRDFGYTLDTALADIIDNSITAGATRVDIMADTSSDRPWIAVMDNGKGMIEAELIEAMRLGSRNPREERTAKDLGRFGLGLKSASLSQCRHLTVFTVRDGQNTCASWDLDVVAARNTWQIDLHDVSDLPDLLLPKKQGTVVLWRKLDRLDGGYTHNLSDRAAVINSAVTAAEQHLRLVFHRFLGGASPRLSLYLNNRRLKPIDPFAVDNTATQFDPPDDLQLAKGLVKIRSVTLPHFKKMTDAAWKEIGGPEGHLKSQGLYIYRADRLIIAGGWLGLIAQTELTKLCRVSVDIPNTMDPEWKIDVKKASAQLPPVVRKRLQRVVERFVTTSKRTYQRRGRKLVEEDRMPMWTRVQKDSVISFRPNFEHAVFREFRERLPTNLQMEFRHCLSLLGATLPIETLHADLFGGAETVTVDTVEAEALNQHVEALVAALLDQGTPAANIVGVLANVDLLKANWTEAKSLIEKLLQEKTV
jgi:hypothetical protein